jgi:ubiquinone/menaquinone biosynthesis C-methylase UbiE
MNTRDATALLAGAVAQRGGTWADLGAGDGTFTRALADLLGPESRIYAVDRDASAVGEIERWAARNAPNVVPVVADFTRELDLPGLGQTQLDGMLLANALHFIRDTERVLARLAERVRPGGRVVIIEYDRRAATPWVPYPIPTARLPGLAASVGLSTPTITATRRSMFGGILYVAALFTRGESTK